MPLQSKAQQVWMFANKPAMAKQWAAETPDMKGLPQRKSPQHQQLVNQYIRQGLKPHGR